MPQISDYKFRNNDIVYLTTCDDPYIYSRTFGGHFFRLFTDGNVPLSHLLTATVEVRDVFRTIKGTMCRLPPTENTMPSETIEINRDDLLSAITGLLLSDNQGDVKEQLGYLLKPFALSPEEISEIIRDEDPLSKLEERDLLPEHQKNI